MPEVYYQFVYHGQIILKNEKLNMRLFYNSIGYDIQLLIHAITLLQTNLHSLIQCFSANSGNPVFKPSDIHTLCNLHQMLSVK